MQKQIPIQNTCSNRKSQSGSALVYTLVMTTIAAILLAGLVQFIVANLKLSASRVEREQAFHIAESGINYYRWYLAHVAADHPTRAQLDTFWTSTSPYPHGANAPYMEDVDGEGQFSITVTPPEAGSSAVEVEAVGWTYKHPNSKRAIKATFRQPSYSEYMFLSNSNVWVKPGEDISGRIHANAGARIDGIAHNIVTSSVLNVSGNAYYEDKTHFLSWILPGWYDEWHWGVHTHDSGGAGADPVSSSEPLAPWKNRPDIFQGGREVNVAEIDFTAILADIALMKKVSGCTTPGNYCADESIGSGGHYYDNTDDGRHITLQGTQYEICTVTDYHQGWWIFQPKYYIEDEEDCQTKNIPQSGVIFIEDNAWVDGTINGRKVTIIAADMTTPARDKNIFLEEDLLYTSYNGNDTIGLVAENDAQITANSENTLRIDAGIIAHSGTMKTAESFNTTKDNITIYGSIISNEMIQYKFMDLISFFFDSGYDTRTFLYDNYLYLQPPPYFPTKSEYVMDLWEEI